MNLKEIKNTISLLLLLAVAFVAVPVQGGTLRAFVPSLQLLQDSVATAVAALDTTAVAPDTLSSKKKTSADAVEDPVYYESSDSMVWSRTGNAYLYGDCSVKYQKIELDAAVISMNMDSSVVRAHGITDSTGVATESLFSKMATLPMSPIK